MIKGHLLFKNIGQKSLQDFCGDQCYIRRYLHHNITTTEDLKKYHDQLAKVN